MSAKARAAYEAARAAKLVGDHLNDWPGLHPDVKAGWERVATAVLTAPSWTYPPPCSCGHQRAAHDDRGCEYEGCPCKRALHSLPMEP
jgi:hypothetical protein